VNLVFQQHVKRILGSDYPFPAVEQGANHTGASLSPSNLHPSSFHTRDKVSVTFGYRHRPMLTRLGALWRRRSSR
jgi:hypothetical protein